MKYGPKTEWASLQVGARIYYTGDMANPCGSGAIIERLPVDPKWGYREVKIAMDDGREWFAIGLTSFQPAPGRRFWLETDWQADRERRIAEFRASMVKSHV